MGYRDPLASITSVPITIIVKDNEYTVPVMWASDWLEVLMRDRVSVLDLVPGLLCEEDQDEIGQNLTLGVIIVSDVQEAANALLSGRDWWVAAKLVGVCKASWDVVGGEMAKLSLQPDRMTFGAWLDAVYSIIRYHVVNGGDPKSAQSRLTKFVNDIELSPNGKDDELDEEAEAEAFLRAMQMAT
jgi:hypothetical protein